MAKADRRREAARKAASTRQATGTGSLTVRINERAHATLGRLKTETGRSMTDLLEDAVERLAEGQVLEQLNRGYAELRGDPAAWEQERSERAAWDTTLGDRLERS